MVAQVMEGSVAGVDEDGSGGQVDVGVKVCAAKAECSPLVRWTLDMQPTIREKPSLRTPQVVLERIRVLSRTPEDASA